jgi:hypothetical protein
MQCQLVACAVHLSCSHTVHCKWTKASTIEQCVLAAASFSLLFSGTGFRKDHPTNQWMGCLLGPVHRDLHECETIPCRHKPYAIEMHALAPTLAAEMSPDGLHHTLLNGFKAGFSFGAGVGKWSQPGCQVTARTPQTVTRLCVVLDADGGDPAQTRVIVPDNFSLEPKTRSG